MATLVVFDTETTGFKFNHIVEIASTIIDHSGDSYTWYSRMKPSSPVEPGAAKVTGITNETVANEPPDTEVIAKWWGDIVGLHKPETGPLVMVGHNVGFDMRAVSKYVNIPKETLTLCTMKLGRAYNPESPNHQLVTLHGHLGLTGDYKAHGAMDDVYMCDNILRHYMRHLGKGYVDLAREQYKPTKLEVMPFGTHKGKKFSELTSNYMSYMLGLPDMDNDVRHSIELELKRRKGR